MLDFFFSFSGISGVGEAGGGFSLPLLVFAKFPGSLLFPLRACQPRLLASDSNPLEQDAWWLQWACLHTPGHSSHLAYDLVLYIEHSEIQVGLDSWHLKSIKATCMALTTWDRVELDTRSRDVKSSWWLLLFFSSYKLPPVAFPSPIILSSRSLAWGHSVLLQNGHVLYQ